MSTPAAVTMLRMARERIAAGAPALQYALALRAAGSIADRLSRAEFVCTAWRAGQQAPSEESSVMDLATALWWLGRAVEEWRDAPAHFPPAAKGDPQCFTELREALAVARRNESFPVLPHGCHQWTRQQSVCVAHLAVLMAEDALRGGR